ncbi:MAG: hypothetical protein ACR2P2_16395, partial [Nakamurella sp.]
MGTAVLGELAVAVASRPRIFWHHRTRRLDITDPRTRVDEVRSRVGIVFQSFNLFPHMSVLDNVTLASRVVH